MKILRTPLSGFLFFRISYLFFLSLLDDPVFSLHRSPTTGIKAYHSITQHFELKLSVTKICPNLEWTLEQLLEREREREEETNPISLPPFILIGGDSVSPPFEQVVIHVGKRCRASDHLGMRGGFRKSNRQILSVYICFFKCYCLNYGETSINFDNSVTWRQSLVTWLIKRALQ